MPDPSKVRDALGALIVMVVVLALAVPRTALGPQAGDSSELVLVALKGTLAHPPGYPLFSLLLEGAVALSPANPFLTCALVSAALQALAAALLFVVASRTARDPVLGASAVLMWLAAPGTLVDATMAEVFALHHVVALVLTGLCLYMLEHAPSARALAALGLVCGLAGAHHPMIVLWAPLPLVVLWRAARAATPATVPRLAGSFVVALVVGLSPYLLLPMRFAHAPFFAFGHVEDLGDVLAHALRQDYGTLALNANVRGASAWSAYTLALLRTAPLACLAVVLALVVAARRRASAHVALAALVLLHVAFAVALKTGAPGALDFHALRFLPSIALPLLLAGVAALSALVPRRRFARLLALTLALPSALALPAALAEADARHDTADAELVTALDARAPLGAVVLDGLDETSFALALEDALGKRPDRVHVVVGQLDAWWARERLRARWPFLRGLDVDAPSWLEPVARAALADGRRVLAAPGVRAPEGLTVVAFGPFAEWLADPVSDHERVERARAACAAIPPSVARIDPARTAAIALRDQAWLAPLLLVPDGQRAAFAAAVERFDAGDQEGARAACGVR